MGGIYFVFNMESNAKIGILFDASSYFCIGNRIHAPASQLLHKHLHLCCDSNQVQGAAEDRVYLSLYSTDKINKTLITVCAFTALELRIEISFILTDMAHDLLCDSSTAQNHKIILMDS